MTFTHGQRVLCTIHGTEIKDAKISIDEDGTPYICQNEQDGYDAKDKLGYKYSWKLEKDFTKLKRDSSVIANLRPATHSWDSLSQADVGTKFNTKKGIFTILEVGISGKTFLPSCANDDEVCGSTWVHIEEAKKLGFTFLDEESTEEVVEMTVEEVSKLVGKKVKIVE